MSDSNKFPTDFVPVSRPLAEELGYQAAYVFGVIWQYCQMEKGFCDASHETIAERAGMSRRSVIDYIEKLIKAGYVEDLTPGVRNAPHQLCTKKGVQILHTKERVMKEEKPIEEPDRYANPAQQNGAGMQELPSGCANSAQLGMQNLHLNRQSQETESIESSKDNIDSQKWNNANKKIVGDKFLELTHLKPPINKKTKGAWWGWLFEIFEMAGKDSAETCRVMGIVINHMRHKHLDITSPKSLINYSRIVTSGQELNGASGYGPAIPRASPTRPKMTEEEERAAFLAHKRQQEGSSV